MQSYLKKTSRSYSICLQFNLFISFVALTTLETLWDQINSLPRPFSQAVWGGGCSLGFHCEFSANQNQAFYKEEKSFKEKSQKVSKNGPKSIKHLTFH